MQANSNSVNCRGIFPPPPALPPRCRWVPSAQGAPRPGRSCLQSKFLPLHRYTARGSWVRGSHALTSGRCPLSWFLPLHRYRGGGELAGRGDGRVVAAGGRRVAFFAARPVNVRFGQGHGRSSSRCLAANLLKINGKGWWAH